jgi:hypothetical protein
VLVGGEIVGTWRRANADVTVQSWRRLTRAERAAVEAEAASLPLPGLERQIALRWDEHETGRPDSRVSEPSTTEGPGCGPFRSCDS